MQIVARGEGRSRGVGRTSALNASPTDGPCRSAPPRPTAPPQLGCAAVSDELGATLQPFRRPFGPLRARQVRPSHCGSPPALASFARAPEAYARYSETTKKQNVAISHTLRLLPWCGRMLSRSVAAFLCLCVDGIQVDLFFLRPPGAPLPCLPFLFSPELFTLPLSVLKLPLLFGGISGAVPSSDLRGACTAHRQQKQHAVSAAGLFTGTIWVRSRRTNRLPRSPRHPARTYTRPAPRPMPQRSHRSHRSGGANCARRGQGGVARLTVWLARLLRQGFDYRQSYTNFCPPFKPRAKVSHVNEFVRDPNTLPGQKVKDLFC